MKHSAYSALTGLLMLAAAASPVLAAEGTTSIKVALLDMTSLMPGGTTGYGMMGRGMMGYGNQQYRMPGYGMGPGMMGYGMGPGMMGYGMMGGMMHGMMSIRVDQPTVKAGAVEFDVTNWSGSVLHEMLIVSVDNPNAPLPYDYTRARVPEDQVKVMGEVSDLKPSATKALNITLAPGSYLLICNVPGHYAAGMVAPFAVSQ